MKTMTADAKTSTEKKAAMGDRIAQREARVRRELLQNASLRMLANRIDAAMRRPGFARTSRPQNASGATSFHFRLEHVTKASNLSAAMKLGSLSAAAFQTYAEREGAAELVKARELSPADLQAAAETLFLMGSQAEHHDASDTAAYHERESAVEVAGSTVASFGNIGSTFEERVGFWIALDRREPEPVNARLKIEPDNDPQFWIHVDADPGAPAVLKGRDKTRKTTVLVDDRSAPRVYQYIKEHKTPLVGLGPQDRSRLSPALFDLARARRVQSKIILDLPHELSPEKRLVLAKRICDNLFEIEDLTATDKDGTPAPIYRVPYHAVVHAPDLHNDPRNFHLHIAYSERPAVRMEDPKDGIKKWDFEIEVTAKDAHRHIRTNRPDEKRRNRALNHRDWPKRVRHTYARLANEAMAAAGIATRYDPRTYREMGIDAPARARLPKKIISSEKKGVANPLADEIIQDSWAKLQDHLAEQYSDPSYPASIDSAFKAQRPRWYGHRVHTLLTRGRNDWRNAAVQILELGADRAAGKLVYDKIASRLNPPFAPAGRTERGALSVLHDMLVAEPTSEIERHHKIKAEAERVLKIATIHDKTTADARRLQLHLAGIEPVPKKLAEKPLSVRIAERMRELMSAAQGLSSKGVETARDNHAAADRAAPDNAAGKARASESVDKRAAERKPIPRADIDAIAKATKDALLRDTFGSGNGDATPTRGKESVDAPLAPDSPPASLVPQTKTVPAKAIADTATRECTDAAIFARKQFEEASRDGVVAKGTAELVTTFGPATNVVPADQTTLSNVTATTPVRAELPQPAPPSTGTLPTPGPAGISARPLDTVRDRPESGASRVKRPFKTTAKPALPPEGVRVGADLARNRRLDTPQVDRQAVFDARRRLAKREEAARAKAAREAKELAEKEKKMRDADEVASRVEKGTTSDNDKNKKPRRKPSSKEIQRRALLAARNHSRER